MHSLCEVSELAEDCDEASHGEALQDGVGASLIIVTADDVVGGGGGGGAAAFAPAP